MQHSVGIKKTSESKLSGHRKEVNTVAWNHDGSILASGSMDHSIRLWTMGKALHDEKAIELKGHTKPITRVCWDPLHRDILASASTDGTVRVWDTRSKKEVHMVKADGENINMTWRRSGTDICVANSGNGVSIIETNKFQILHTTKFKHEVNEMAWSADDNFLLFTTGIGQLELYTTPKLQPVTSIYAHTSNIYCIEVSPSAKYFALGSADSLVSLWDSAEYLCLRTFDRQNKQVRSISFANDERFIAAASDEKGLELYHVESGSHAYTHDMNCEVTTVAWNPQSYVLAIASESREDPLQLLEFSADR
eukprot:TRINITY_DN6838_c0_g1_i1.p1 TRINITY_DN6838_c0_g1~~TRINITY_DN6838_c0_g1_i1.p1  ORF type:complete len:308 (+),score=64.53 TRINITY_DN6838_c0_g1_i1:65-988(+)